MLVSLYLAFLGSTTFVAGSSATTRTFNSNAGFTNASLVSSADKKAACVTGTIYINVSTATNTRFLYAGPANNMAATELFVEYTQANSSIVAELGAGGNATVGGRWAVFGKLCLPIGIAEGVKTVQLLTHGGTLDYTYWDIAPNYSYVDVAAEAGYATFSYDRLGTGLSEHPDPIQVLQMPLQVEIIHGFVQMLRAGDLAGLTFEKVVGVGHSVGAGLSQGVTTQYPSDFDAVILTGHSTDFTDALVGSVSTGMQIANTDPSGRFKGLANGYFSLAPVEQAHQYAFYRYPYYDQQSMLLRPLLLNFVFVSPF